MELLVVLLIAGAAVAAVLIPLVRRGSPHDRGLDPDAAAPRQRDPAAVERTIRRYRTALRAGTVCGRCGRANPQGSRFCAECGRRLPAGRGRIRPTSAAQ